MQESVKKWFTTRKGKQQISDFYWLLHHALEVNEKFILDIYKSKINCMLTAKKSLKSM